MNDTNNKVMYELKSFAEKKLHWRHTDELLSYVITLPLTWKITFRNNQFFDITAYDNYDEYRFGFNVLTNCIWMHWRINKSAGEETRYTGSYVRKLDKFIDRIIKKITGTNITLEGECVPRLIDELLRLNTNPDAALALNSFKSRISK